MFKPWKDTFRTHIWSVSIKVGVEAMFWSRVLIVTPASPADETISSHIKKLEMETRRRELEFANTRKE